jgi:uncharacterized membrane protein
MKHMNDNIADLLLTTSVISSIAHYSSLMQPIVSLFAGLIAIVSGIFAIRYYYLKSKTNG